MVFGDRAKTLNLINGIFLIHQRHHLPFPDRCPLTDDAYLKIPLALIAKDHKRKTILHHAAASGRAPVVDEVIRALVVAFNMSDGHTVGQGLLS